MVLFLRAWADLCRKNRLLQSWASALAMFGLALALGAVLGRSLRWAYLNGFGGQNPAQDPGLPAPLAVEQKHREPWVSSQARLAFDATALPAGYWAPWCDSAADMRASELRRACDVQQLKAARYWRNFDEAERESMLWLQSGELSALEPFIACDAFDLTWYELSCPSDLDPVTPQAIAAVLNQAGPAALAVAHWQREPASGVALRSRLVSPLLRLDEPWTPEDDHPELRTLLLLEKKTDGRIYIGGVPVTGVSAQSELILE